MQRLALRGLLAWVLAVTACGPSASNPDGGGNPSDGAPGVDADDSYDPVFDEVTLDGCGASGYQTTIAAAGNRVALASLSFTRTTGKCNTMNGEMDVSEYDICYAEAVAGGTFSVTTAETEQYLALTGVGLALSTSGEAMLAWTGGDPASLRCGGTDMLVARGTAGSFGFPTQVALGSQSADIVPDQAEACAAQNVCNSGDATGFWPAVVWPLAGEPMVAFRDIHFGFANDDFASSDVEFAAAPGYSITTIDVSRGGGLYLRIAVDPLGQPAVAHYNGDGASGVNGIWVHHRVSGTWQATKVTSTRIGEQLGFGVSPGGLFSLAYYDSDSAKLVYQESTDGATWSDPVAVDTDGVVGLYPSLAFDVAGQPAIAYYRCNDYHPTDRSCSVGKDGLRMARRAGGTWRVYPVRAEDGVFDGLYPAIAFVNGKAVIAFQSRWYDPGSGQNDILLHVAREQ